jgi:uncharacterized protein (DUF1501 family)
MISRRIFLKDGGLAVVGLSMVPGFVYRTALAAQPLLAGKKTLVTIFQRGGVDGLNMVIPHGDPHYYAHRSSIAIPRPSGESESALELDGFFGLNPQMAPLHRIYQEGHLAIINAAGSPHTTRSHFRAQDYMESAAPGGTSASDGWLNRHLQTNQHQESSTFRGIAMVPNLPMTLKG